MGFPRQATRKEDQTLNEKQGKHHVEKEEEDKGKQQGGGNETTRECLVKRQQNCQIRRGLGHHLIFLR
jgi:hypothetical protein